MNGKVKWFDLRKGYGYVTGEDGNDYFVHRSNIEVGRTYTGLSIGDDVVFDTSDANEKGPQAVGVKLLLSE